MIRPTTAERDPDSARAPTMSMAGIQRRTADREVSSKARVSAIGRIIDRTKAYSRGFVAVAAARANPLRSCTAEKSWVAVNPGIVIAETSDCFVTNCTSPRAAKSDPASTSRRIRVSNRARSRMPSLAISNTPAYDSARKIPISAPLISTGECGFSIATI